jgi:hypothetical protein
MKGQIDEMFASMVEDEINEGVNDIICQSTRDWQPMIGYCR